MTTALLVVLVVCVHLFAWALCRVSSDADHRSEALLRERREGREANEPDETADGTPSELHG